MGETMVKLSELQDHFRVYSELEQYFKSSSSVIGIFLSGSCANDTMDQYSDIDIGIVYDSDKNMETYWALRWDWDLPKWFHRFDADHVRDHFVIYIFEPNVKVDIVLYTMDSLPPPKGGPYRLTYAEDSSLLNWMKKCNEKVNLRISSAPLEWEVIIHDDERIWAWLIYCYLHIARGEYYTIAADFFMLRAIVEKWIAYFKYKSTFETRRLEFKFSLKEIEELKNLFPNPERESLVCACKSLINVTITLRKDITSQFGSIWRTSEECIEKVKANFDSL